jgi:hypothetical protein
LTSTLLQVGHASLGQPGTLGELGLREPGLFSQLAETACESLRLTHRFLPNPGK